MQGLKTLEEYSKEIEPKIRSHRQQVMQQLQVLDVDCTNKHAFNEAKYVECMKKLGKRISKHSKELEFGLLFWKHNTFQCFDRQAQENQNVQVCKDKQNKQLDEILHKFQL